MTDIDVLLQENRKFSPPESFRRNAVMNDASAYTDAARDPEGFWAEQAESLDWFKKWKTVLEWKPPRPSGSSAGSSTSR